MVDTIHKRSDKIRQQAVTCVHLLQYYLLEYRKDLLPTFRASSSTKRERSSRSSDKSSMHNIKPELHPHPHAAMSHVFDEISLNYTTADVHNNRQASSLHVATATTTNDDYNRQLKHRRTPSLNIVMLIVGTR